MSLRGRLLAAVGAVALLALLAADIATYSALRSFLYNRVDSSLDVADATIEHSLFRGGRGFHPGPEVAIVAPGTYVEQRASDDTVVAANAAYEQGGKQSSPALPSKLNDSQYLTVKSATPGGPRFRALVSPLPDGGQLIVALPLSETTATLGRLVKIELAVTLAALAIAFAVGWWLVRVGLQPLRDVETTANAIAAGELDRRVPGESNATEVGRLATALNVMLTRIQAAFHERDQTEAKLRRFVADASHELRTPLSAVAAYAELFERGADKHPADLPRVMAGIRTETARMGELVEDLLLLARLDEGRPLEREPVELVDLASTAVQAARAVGPEWPIRLEAMGPVQIVGDDARLRQVLDNLLANVRAHTPEGTSASVRVLDEGDAAVITVADDGPGMSEEEAAHVFERFFRVEASRSRQTGGNGLGLAIVSAIVAAHGGRVAVSSQPGRGAAFMVRLPKTTEPGTDSDTDAQTDESRPAA
jgi:two-component system, OmpR family, sensor kinase